jgi:hypothetical protein
MSHYTVVKHSGKKKQAFMYFFLCRVTCVRVSWWRCLMGATCACWRRRGRPTPWPPHPATGCTASDSLAAAVSHPSPRFALFKNHLSLHLSSFPYFFDWSLNYETFLWDIKYFLNYTSKQYSARHLFYNNIFWIIFAKEIQIKSNKIYCHKEVTTRQVQNKHTDDKSCLGM